MATSFRLLALAGALFGICSASTARADPIPVTSVTVTSGSAQIAWDDPSSFGVFGEGLALVSLFPLVPVSPQRFCFSGCEPGAAVEMRAVFGGPSAGLLGQAQLAVVDGVPYANPSDHETWLSLTGIFLFDAPSVVLPAFPSEAGRISVDAPFSFQGFVAGFAPGNPEVPRFEAELNGGGTATLRLSFQPGNDRYNFPEVTYSFAAVDPIPEPTTLVLVATGLAGAVIRRASRRRIH